MAKAGTTAAAREVSPSHRVWTHRKRIDSVLFLWRVRRRALRTLGLPSEQQVASTLRLDSSGTAYSVR
jgi:hypothetical protein